jgi:hypothetical protein
MVDGVSKAAQEAAQIIDVSMASDDPDDARGPRWSRLGQGGKAPSRSARYGLETRSLWTSRSFGGPVDQLVKRVRARLQRSHEIMSNRHERRVLAATSRKRPVKLNTATLDQHLNDMLCRVGAEFERTGKIDPAFECVTDSASFYVSAHWPDRSAKAAACAALRDSFRRRGVNRYVFASEAWVGKTPGLLPSDDPDRSERVQVIAVERNGPRRYAFAEIKRNAGTATLGQWQVTGDIPPGWLFELLEEGYSDRPPKEEPPVPKLSAQDFQYLMYKGAASEAELRGS